MATSYRNWLQSLANGSGLPSQEASALLQVVGDDFGVNQNFLSDPYGYTGNERGQIRVNSYDNPNEGYWYGPQGTSALNSKYSQKYQSQYGPQVAGMTTDGSGSSGGSSYDPQDLAYLDDQKSLYQRLMRSADSTLDNGLKDLTNSYTGETNKANLQRGRALEDFGKQRTLSEQNKQQAVGTVNTNARTLSDSLRRIIGMASGSGSSAYRFAAPNAVARQASQQRNNVMTKYGQNEADLVTSEDRAKTDFDSLLQDLLSQRQQREEDLRAGVIGQKQGLTQALSDLEAERQRLVGGSYQDTRLATAPYRRDYLNFQDQIDSLPSRFSTKVNPKAVEVKPVSLRDYVVDRQAINASKQSGQSQYSPYAQFLKQRDEEEQLA